MKKVHLSVISLLFAGSVFSQSQFTKFYPESLNKERLTTVIGSETASYIAVVSFLSLIWYKDHDRVPFHYYNDSKGYLQIDKAGHAYSAYRESYSAYYALRWAGVNRKKALIYGGPVGLLFQTPIEIFDGLYEGYGFSWYDMIANTFGSTLFMTQEAILKDQVVLMKFSYSPSIYPQYHPNLGESPIESFFLDYNAHTYWLSGNLNRLSGCEKIPSWINIAFGYSANGMINEFDNPRFYRGKPVQHLERYRQYLFSLDVDFSKIPTNNKWLSKVFRTINLLKLPFPALELNNVDGVKFRGLYF